MSDEEGVSRKSGYRLEIASTSRAKCKGPKPCNGTPITKGSLRMGTIVDFRGNTSFAWRHWGCVTPRIIENMKKSFDSATELDGFDELPEEEQAKVEKAWEEGHVADDDIPDTARKHESQEEEDEGGEKGKGKNGKREKKKFEEVGADGGTGDKKVKRVAKRTRKPKEESDEEAPIAKRQRRPMKGGKRTKARKKNSEDEKSEDLSDKESVNNSDGD